MAQSLDATYPTIARWVQAYGRIEIGQDEFSRSFIRAIDPGGMVWEGQEHYPTLDVTACNPNRPGLQSARSRDHIRCIYHPAQDRILCT